MSNESRRTEPSHDDISLPLVTTEAVSPGCCGGLGISRTTRCAFGALAALAVVGIAFLAGRSTGPSPASGPVISFPPIDATAAVTSEKFSMATGLVTEGSEGLFVLDHNSGLLQCSVIYPRLGQFAANYTANVADALASGGKGGQYMMVTGIADFPRSSSTPIGQSVVYVLDSTTGNFACYAIPFNRAVMNANQPQSGALRLIAVGSASPMIDRDRLR